MKKLFVFFTVAWFAASSVQAVETSGTFSDDTITLASAIKIGKGGIVSSSQYIPGVHKGFPGGGGGGGGNGGNDVDLAVCSTNNDCEDDEKCSADHACVPVCTPNSCSKGQMCVNTAAHVGKCGLACDFVTCENGMKCVNEGSSAKCVGCLTDSDCGSGGVCTDDNICISSPDPCDGVTCATGHRCMAGQCEPYPLGSTEDPQCSSTQVANGSGGCKNPCEGVVCPRGKICTASNGKACCGDCTLKAVNLGSLKTINSQLKLSTATPLKWHPQLNVCLPQIAYPVFKAEDFVIAKKPIPYTGLVRAVELDPNLTDRTITGLIKATPVEFKLDNTLSVEKAVELRSDPVIVKAVTNPNATTLTVEKATVSSSPILTQLK